MPESWRVTPWTAEWYARDEWEKELGDDFYEDGVFHRRFGGDLQGVLDKLIGKLTFDPLAFCNQKAKEQAETLRQLAGLDIPGVTWYRAHGIYARLERTSYPVLCRGILPLFFLRY